MWQEYYHSTTNYDVVITSIDVRKLGNGRVEPSRVFLENVKDTYRVTVLDHSGIARNIQFWNGTR